MVSDSTFTRVYQPRTPEEIRRNKLVLSRRRALIDSVRAKGNPREPQLRQEAISKLTASLIVLFEQASDSTQAEADFRQAVKAAGRGNLLGPEKRQQIEFPTVAPVLWMDRVDRQQSPPDFIKNEKNYGPWLGKGLTRAHIHKLDAPLYNALAKWLRSNDMPPDVDLPTRSQQVTRDVKAAGVSVLHKDAKESLRLASAAMRRGAFG